IEAIVCETAGGIVHRLWEPLAAKQTPPNAYAAKFSIPFCVALGFLTGKAGLESFTEEAAADPKLRALAGRVTYAIDPDNPYPNEFTGHMRVRMRDGRTLEARQPHIRGGAHEPLSRVDIENKFRGNCEFGGWPRERADKFLQSVSKFFDSPLNLTPLRG
ncbi:MAG: MmgE/PrpD family protein, partial [Betaproteobacteria bacterium]|nr:MmgE/PrpD family protein [Betaproteobacteria bacterium]